MVAEKLNFYRFLSHFRCIHRGAFFSQMRTTSVRKLLPEAWGMLNSVSCAFICAIYMYVALYFVYFLAARKWVMTFTGYDLSHPRCNVLDENG